MAATASTSHDSDDWDALWSDLGDTTDNNPAQRMRRRLALRLLPGDRPVQRLLDIGSGLGDLIGEAQQRWPDAGLLGIEMTPTGVEWSRRKVSAADFEVVDLLKTKQPPASHRGWATHAVCSEVLEHVDDPAELMRNARGWLAPGCRVIVTVPGGPMSAYDNHIGHRRHFTPESITSYLTEAGYEVDFASGAGYPFFNLYRRVVIARGEQLVVDANSDAGEGSGLLARVVMGMFRPLLWIVARPNKRGWQMVAVARVPATQPVSD